MKGKNMKEETKNILRNQIDSHIESLKEKGLTLSPTEEMLYRQGIVMGLNLSIYLLTEVDTTELLEACGCYNGGKNQ